MPRLTEGPFRYRRYADAFIDIARRYTSMPLKQAVISPSALSLCIRPRGSLATRRRSLGRPTIAGSRRSATTSRRAATPRSRRSAHGCSARRSRPSGWGRGDAGRRRRRRAAALGRDPERPEHPPRAAAGGGGAARRARDDARDARIHDRRHPGDRRGRQRVGPEREVRRDVAAAGCRARGAEPRGAARGHGPSMPRSGAVLRARRGDLRRARRRKPSTCSSSPTAGRSSGSRGSRSSTSEASAACGAFATSPCAGAPRKRRSARRRSAGSCSTASARRAPRPSGRTR